MSEKSLQELEKLLEVSWKAYQNGTNDRIKQSRKPVKGDK